MSVNSLYVPDWTRLTAMEGGLKTQDYQKLHNFLVTFLWQNIWKNDCIIRNLKFTYQFYSTRSKITSSQISSHWYEVHLASQELPDHYKGIDRYEYREIQNWECLYDSGKYQVTLRTWARLQKYWSTCPNWKKRSLLVVEEKGSDT